MKELLSSFHARDSVSSGRDKKGVENATCSEVSLTKFECLDSR